MSALGTSENNVKASLAPRGSFALTNLVPVPFAYDGFREFGNI